MRYAFAMLVLLPGPAHSATFGFGPDVDVGALGYCSPMERATYFKCTSAPKPHSDMEGYVLQSLDGRNHCFIKGIGKDVSTSVFGDEIQDETDRIARQLASRYGNRHEKIDYLRSGSIWDSPEDWMMGLLKDERSYAYIWDLEGAPVDDIVLLGASANASRTDRGYVTVEFYTTRKDECDRILEDSQSQSF